MAIPRNHLIILLLAALLLAVTLLLVMTDVAVSENPTNPTSDLSWNVIGAGGGHAASTSYGLEATLGQSFVGASSGSASALSAGFWQAATNYRIYLPLIIK